MIAAICFCHLFIFIVFTLVPTKLFSPRNYTFLTSITPQIIIKGLFVRKQSQPTMSNFCLEGTFSEKNTVSPQRLIGNRYFLCDKHCRSSFRLYLSI